MRRELVEFNITQQQLEQMFAPSNALTTTSWEKIWMQNVVENLRKQQQELAVLKDKTVSKLKELGCN